MKQFSLTVADPGYFIRYGPALVMSAMLTDNPLYIAVVDWGDRSSEVCELSGRMRALAERYPTEFQVWSTALPCHDVRERRVFHACARYHVADRMLQDADEDMQIHSMDIDSVFMKPLGIPPDVKLGLYMREDEDLGSTEQERRGMKVLGHTILGSACGDYVSRVSRYIANHNWDHWFLDQEALYYSLTDVERAVLWDMKGKNLIDWDFTPEGKIWSGKGPRKFNDQTYLVEFNKMTQRFLKETE